MKNKISKPIISAMELYGFAKDIVFSKDGISARLEWPKGKEPKVKP